MLIGIVTILLTGVGVWIAWEQLKSGKKSSDNKSVHSEIAQSDNAHPIIVQGDHNTILQGSASGAQPASQTKSPIKTRLTLQILFIDDEQFQVMQMLRKMGWKCITWKADISSFDDVDLLNSDVIFVDIKGVGHELGFSNEGVGLANAIQQRFPEKYIVIYSGTHEHNIFDPDLNQIKRRLPKNAEPIQFNNILEEYVSGIH